MPAKLPVACSVALSLALVATVLASDRARAQTRLTANYTISLARIPIGKISWTVEIGDAAYTAAGSGEASGLLSILASGKGSATTQGSVADGALSPTSFASDLIRDADRTALKMALDRGAVIEISGAEREASESRVPLTEAHHRNIVDPLTALLVPAAAAGEGTPHAACDRTLPIFDGHRRYDLRLRLKRVDKATGNRGYAGPVAVCALTLVPIAGHRADSKLVKFLAGRDIELWLAPVAGTRLLAPIRLSIAHMLGNLVVQASELHAASGSASAATLSIVRGGHVAPPGLTPEQ